MSDKKPFKIEEDFLKAKENAENMSKSLLEKFPWIKSFRFKGDSSFTPGRSKEKIKKKAEAGEEVSFGLNQEMIYIDLKGDEKRVDIIMKYKPKPFYSINLKAMSKNPTVEEFINQMKDTWVYLASGGSPENPKSVLITKIDWFPIQCFKLIVEKDSKFKSTGRFRINFGKVISWKSVKSIDLFGKRTATEEIKKIRLDI